MAAVIGRGIKKGLHGMGGGNSTGLGEIPIEDAPGHKACLKSTFVPYYTVVFSLNGVIILIGLLSQFDFHNQQRNTHWVPTDTWYIANAVFGVLHILAAIYIVYKFEEPNNNHASSSSFHKTSRDVEAFGYHNMQGAAPSMMTMDMPPPPQNPNYIQAHEVVVVPMDKSAAAPSATFPHAPPRFPPVVVTEPLTWPRIKYVLTEDKFVAIYILVFCLYLAWHYFMDFSHFSYYQYYHGMYFVMKCADIFIVAGPASLLFSIGYTLTTQR